MPTIQIPNDKLVMAQYAEAWSICLWGNPQMTVVCGHCSASFHTRDYRPHNVTNEAIAHCPHCNYWNRTRLIMNG